MTATGFDMTLTWKIRVKSQQKFTFSNSSKETLETCVKYVRRSGVLVVNFEHISHFFLKFLMLNLNNYLFAEMC